jgi:hypothetical protein
VVFTRPSKIRKTASVGHSLHPADITFHMICSSLQPAVVLNRRVHLPLLSMLQGKKIRHSQLAMDLNICDNVFHT